VIANGQLMEPEQSKPREDFAFPRNSVRQDMIKCTDAVGSHKQESIAEVVNIPHFSPADRDPRDDTLEQHRHETTGIREEVRNERLECGSRSSLSVDMRLNNERQSA
jgi:hypothetical protein